MSIKQNNNDSNKEILSGDYLNFTNDCCVSDNKFNYDTISKYYSIVYKSDLKNAPNVCDLTFLWAHIIGDLDDWAKNGLAGDASDFRWNNQSLPTPLPVDTQEENAVNIVSTLPREDTIWTPDWYVYPQTSINRYNPKWWNQFYFDFMKKYAINLPENATNNENARFNYNNIQENVTFEVSNTGGPAPNGDGTQTFFFYHAVGSGIRITVDKCLFAMNKIHAYYVYQCADPTATPITAFNKVIIDLAGTDLINQMNQALTLKSGYFALKDQAFVDDMLWTPLLNAYPSDGIEIQQKIHAVVCYNIGLKSYTPAASFTAPSPNIFNADCVASNAFNGLLPSGADPMDKNYVGTSNVALKAYEYYVQVATNLTVMDNILDTYVNKILDHTENNLGINAVVNLAQWNALGGWTGEIPSYYGLITTGQKPVFKPTNGCTFDESTVSGEGWNILGINNYSTSCPNFQISSKYL
jgi:hypothetical protein